jgi:hypothetical protein
LYSLSTRLIPHEILRLVAEKIILTFRGRRSVSERKRVISLNYTSLFQYFARTISVYDIGLIGGADQWLLFGGRVVKVKLE